MAAAPTASILAALDWRSWCSNLTIAGESKTVQPQRNWNTYAAVIAALIDLLALIVSGYTAYVLHQQLRAQA